MPQMLPMLLELPKLLGLDMSVELANLLPVPLMKKQAKIIGKGLGLAGQPRAFRDRQQHRVTRQLLRQKLRMTSL